MHRPPAPRLLAFGSLLLALALACRDMDDTGDDTAAPGPEVTPGTRCALDPALPDGIALLRLARDGALWIVDGAGVLWRYEPVGAGCDLTGVWAWGHAGDLDTVTDIALDDTGRAWVLEFFGALVLIDETGLSLASCEVHAGHAVAAQPDGSRAYTWAIGEEALYPVEVDGSVCVPSTTGIPTERALGTANRMGDAGLAVASFDPTGTLPPAHRIDPDDGAWLGDLGTGTDPRSDRAIGGTWDLCPVGTGAWIVDSTGYDLWEIGEDGAIADLVLARDLVAEGARLGSLACDAAGPVYVSATLDGEDGVWAIAR